MSDERKQWDHLYTDETDIIRDSHIEHMYDDIFYDKNLDEILYKNLCIYTELLYPIKPMPPKDVLTNTHSVMDWAICFSFLTVWQSDQTDRNALKREDSEEYLYGAKLGGFEKGLPSLAKSAHLAVLLSVIQMFRELVDEVNNVKPDKSAIQ